MAQRFMNTMGGMGSSLARRSAPPMDGGRGPPMPGRRQPMEQQE